MELERGSGILFHVSSAPSGFGIGDIGPELYRIADQFSEHGQAYWQMLPLNPTDAVYGHSPYSSPSAFAGNALLISPQGMYERGWLEKTDLDQLGPWPEGRVDYQRASELKGRLLEKAFCRFSPEEDPSYQEFYDAEKQWLENYALFMTVKQLYPGKRWDQWPGEIKGRDPAALERIRRDQAEMISKICFQQYVFSQQWQAFHDHCRQQGLRLIGDIPIYVNDDSADVWANPKYFKLNKNLRPEYVAGVPPDYFSETGQRWGNPVYDWDVLKEDGFSWWMRRLRRQFDLFDIIRVDHFRGFEAFWEIPADEKTAVNGTWVPGPRDDFFHAVEQAFPGLPIIAEDLGTITDEVTDLMNRFHIPGMKVLQFAFNGDPAEHPYIPENFEESCVVYTGTHDNNTTRGWYADNATKEEKKNLVRYLGHDPDPDQVAWDLITVSLSSIGCLAVTPLQDVLNLGSEARMNTPATHDQNWSWQLKTGQSLAPGLSRLHDLARDTGRL
ncbi:MAG: 4-alpha-glucanotransferase [Candidatus Omnitrophota bacterium]